MQRPEEILHRWLSQLKITVSGQYLKQQLLSHPDYPSLLSITDTLDELDIEHAAVEVEKDRFNEIPTPFLAHLNSRGGEFVIVNDAGNINLQIPEFIQQWSGIVVAAEKPAGWRHPVNEEHLKEEQQQKRRISFYLILAGLLAIIAVLQSFIWMYAALVLITASGLFVAYLIVTKELGITNRVADQFCGKDAGCTNIINSKGSKLVMGIGWSDVGIIWFAALLLQLVIAAFTGTATSLLFILSFLSVAALPFTFFSIYYQWQKAKKWCRLCLVTVGLLWAQFIVLLPVFAAQSWNEIAAGHIFFVITILMITGIVWLPVKSSLKQNRELKKDNNSLLRFKRNIDVFMALLEKQKRVNVSPFEHDLQLGNAEAPLQIMVACNPYCNPCARAHEVLHKLVEKYENDLGLTIRFTIQAEKKEDKKTQVVAHILQYIQQQQLSLWKRNKLARELLHSWFVEMDYEKFAHSFPVHTNTNVDDYLKDHELWSNESDIHATPTLFINGCELPSTYTIRDLPLLLPVLKEQTKEKEPEYA